jgi:hypothetical protein
MSGVSTSWHTIAVLATSAGAKYPELCAAQWALESSWGSKQSGKNNFFGLKGKGTNKTTTEYVDGKPVTIDDEFLDFNSAQECVNYLVQRWYKDFDGYSGVNRASSREDAARMLESEGYATDPQYAEKLIKIMNSNSVPSKSISLKDAAANYKKLKHQDEGWLYLQKTLSQEELSKFASLYRGGDSVGTSKIANPLKVPYFYQRDSKTGHGERCCQASAIAMVLKYLNKDLIVDDDDYLNLVFRYGDTVSQAAHSKALQHLGVKHKFCKNGSEKDILRLIDNGYPVPLGILHKGDLNNPTGGGHYVTIIGYDDTYFYVHDPFGELNVVGGGYLKTRPTDGRSQMYTRKNLLKRWLIQSNSDGWYWDLSGNDLA